MDKERLRIPSDSSSGSSSRGGASPNPSSFRNGKQPSYMLINNNIGPPSNSPGNFSPLLPQSQPPHSLPPPPGLTHPGIGSIYQYPPCGAPGFQNINYALGMPTIAPAGQAHVHGHHNYPSVSGTATGQYNMNRFGVQNGIMQAPPASPPPGYNFFGNLHMPQPQPVPQPCAVSANQHPSHGQYASQFGPYTETGDPIDLEKRINLLLGVGNSNTSSEFYDNGGFNGGNFISHLNTGADEMINGNSPFCSKIGAEKQTNDVDSVVGGVMNPIIENIVGSINNGAYTHFGPSITPTDKMQNGNGQTSDLFRESNIVGRHNGTAELERKALFSKIAVNSVNKEVSMSVPIKENAVGTITTGIKPQPINPVTTSPFNEICNDSAHANANGSFGKSPSPVGQPRASSPKDVAESLSRPQTPGKPSYLEVLTKASLKNQQNGNSSTNRKTSSTSSSPVQSAFSANSDSVPNLSCHRKSVDYFIGSTSTPSSSCPSASSSPATKPRNLMPGLLLKGKENVSTAKFTGAMKNSPSSSPSHSGVQQQQLKAKAQTTGFSSERKVLSSQNNSANSTNSSKSGGKTAKNGKILFEKAMELGEAHEEEEWGWKTYAPRGRNNNLTSVGNKNSQKRTSNGHCSSESLATNSTYFEDENDDDLEGKKHNGGNEIAFEKKSGSSTFGSSGCSSSSTVSHSRKPKEKEKQRRGKEDRNCVRRKLETTVYKWLAHLISALTWLWSLITDVATLSASVGISLMNDLYTWTKTKAVPNCMEKVTRCQKEVWQVCSGCWLYCKTKVSSLFFRGSCSNKRPEETNSKPGTRVDEHLISLLGPERNIALPANGDEALKRLLSVKGQDPYSILGVRSDSNDETIRRYYKRQAVLVHPDKNLIVGAEEAFKILARAFEMVGDPVKRTEYHQKLMEAQAKEKFCGEIGNLLEQLRKKMEAASSTIRCTKCNSRHKKNITDRPLFAARFCSQCRIHHGAREGELWAERGGFFGIAWNYFACMDAHVWEINEWARCQKANLKHIKADAHCVMYRLVAGGNNHQNHNQHCQGNGASFEDGVGSEADEWDSLINNLYKSPPGSAFGKTTGVSGKPGCCGNGNLNTSAASSTSQAAGRRRKGKRNK